MHVTVVSAVPPEDARARLRASVEARARLDPADAAADRRLRGEVTDDELRLRVEDSRFDRRRKSWNVELIGTFSPTGEGCVLTGSVGIPDAAALRWIMRLFRVAAAMPLLLVVLLTIRDGIDSSTLLEAVLAAGALAVTVGGTVFLEREGTLAAADDAAILVAYLRARLG